MFEKFSNLEGFKRYINRTPFTHMAWDKLYRKCVFEDVRYPVDRLAEDMATTYKTFGMLIYYLCFYSFSLNLLRQSIAMSIIFWSYNYIVERKPVKFCISAAIAVGFHLTAAIMLYVIVMLVTQVLTNVATAVCADKLYPQYKPYGCVEEKDRKAINGQIRDLFTSKIGAIIYDSADTIVISAFLGLTILAVYQNYFYILNAITGLINLPHPRYPRFNCKPYFVMWFIQICLGNQRRSRPC